MMSISSGESLKQFYLDAPRITFKDELVVLKSAPTKTLYAFIQTWAKTHNRDVHTIIHWCTQIPLASLYKEHLKKINEDSENRVYHLVDTGRQTITFLKSGQMRIFKPFRVYAEQKNDVMIMHNVDLIVLKDGNRETVEWNSHAISAHDTPWFSTTNGLAVIVAALGFALYCTY